MKNTLIIWGIVLLVILGSVGIIIKLAKNRPASTGLTGSIPAVSSQDNSRGPKDAKVVLVEYSDFQCPACGSFYPTVEELNKELGDKILYVYRNFPLPQHQNAEIAAYAAEASARQGKFWEMYSLLFANQREWSEGKNARDYINKYAGTIGLNMDKFGTDIVLSEIKDKVSGDETGGANAGVNSTPTFFLNGKKLEGYNTYDDFKNLIRAAVKAS